MKVEKMNGNANSQDEESNLTGDVKREVRYDDEESNLTGDVKREVRYDEDSNLTGDVKREVRYDDEESSSAHNGEMLNNDSNILTGEVKRERYDDEESSSSHNGEMLNNVGNILTEDILKEERELEKKRVSEEEKMRKKIQEENEKMEEEKCFKRLNLLLSRSTIYAQFMAEKLQIHEKKQKQKENRMQKKALKEQEKPVLSDSATNQRSTRKAAVLSSSQEQEEPVLSDSANKKSTKRKAPPLPSSPSKKQKSDQMFDVLKKQNMINISCEESEAKAVSNESKDSISHPSLFYGGVMRPYQLDGYQWLKTLYENGVNGILADEMGLGKTIQCIAFIAYLVEMGITGPFLVVAPLSTIPNWVSEFKRFTPDIPVILYHGPKAEREAIRSKITKKVKGKVTSCPVVITSYQVPLMDCKKLKGIEWKMLVIDEAHRIKNHECMLIKSLKSFNAEHRLLMTGTPLQNNLAELWSLLNFILPEIFDDLAVFQSWFDIQKLSQNGATHEIVSKQQERQLISTIHQILTPFLLRRTKSDVELGLPPKKEIVVHAPMTKLQLKYYTGVINKSIARMLEVQTCDDEVTILTTKRIKRKANYFGCDDSSVETAPVSKKCYDEYCDPDDFLGKVTLKLQNPSMILRKICNHPYLINDPMIPANEDFVRVSGKMLVLDTLLRHLKERGHKVIIFSQFISMLHILEDYCTFRKYNFSSLYGYMDLDMRQENLEEYKDKDTFIFLISTKAGGLGLNIISADTVIIYDSDWNPQGDLQAQDRCHRIGQTKPVVVYRLIVPNSVDQRIYDYSTAKRKLEKAVIQKGRFNSNDIARQQGIITREELLELLESSDNCGFVETKDVLSPKQIEELLDRSDMMK